MNIKTLRNAVFYLHRWIGLAVGLVAIMIGLTGSLLVFQHEINEFLMHQQIGAIVPESDRMTSDTILEKVKAAYATQPDIKFERIYLPEKPTAPYKVGISSPAIRWNEIIVHPYTGAILKSQPWESSFFGIVYRLHYALLADQIGMTIVGIIALLMCILVMTGIILWPGWRKLISGFKSSGLPIPSELVLISTRLRASSQRCFYF